MYFRAVFEIKDKTMKKALMTLAVVATMFASAACTCSNNKANETTETTECTECTKCENDSTACEGCDSTVVVATETVAE